MWREGREEARAREMARDSDGVCHKPQAVRHDLGWDLVYIQMKEERDGGGHLIP